MTTNLSKDSDREKFEHYMLGDCFRDLQELTRSENGDYDDADVQALWESWSKAIAAQAAQAVPVNWLIEQRKAHSKWSTSNTPPRESAAFLDGFDAAMKISASNTNKDKS